jgi:hypothetical protein
MIKIDIKVKCDKYLGMEEIAVKRSRMMNVVETQEFVQEITTLADEPTRTW